MMYSFKDKLKESQSAEWRRRWDAVYRHYWPQVERIEEVHSLALQQVGVDVQVRRGALPLVRVEEKSTGKVRDTMFVELWSQWYGDGHRRNRPGWSVRDDMLTDYLAYGWADRCLLIPWQAYRNGVDAGLPLWRQTRRLISVKNRNYETLGIWVERQELLKRCIDAMHVRFDEVCL
jgi:hypothetical protein